MSTSSSKSGITQVEISWSELSNSRHSEAAKHKANKNKKGGSENLQALKLHKRPCDMNKKELEEMSKNKIVFYVDLAKMLSKNPETAVILDTIENVSCKERQIKSKKQKSKTTDSIKTLKDNESAQTKVKYHSRVHQNEDGNEIEILIVSGDHIERCSSSILDKIYFLNFRNGYGDDLYMNKILNILAKSLYNNQGWIYPKIDKRLQSILDLELTSRLLNRSLRK